MNTFFFVIQLSNLQFMVSSGLKCLIAYRVWIALPNGNFGACAISFVSLSGVLGIKQSFIKGEFFLSDDLNFFEFRMKWINQNIVITFSYNGRNFE